MIIVVLACVEGPVLSMIFGVLIKLNLFSFIPVYTALMAGDLLGDSIWYYIGYRWGHRFILKYGKYVNITEENVEKVTNIFHKYKHPILFISKISNGFGFALVTLVTAGIVKIPFGRYLLINFLGQFIWSGLLICVGYYFSHFYIQVDNWLGKTFIIAIFILLVISFNGYRKYLKGKMEKI